MNLWQLSFTVNLNGSRITWETQFFVFLQCPFQGGFTMIRKATPYLSDYHPLVWGLILNRQEKMMKPDKHQNSPPLSHGPAVVWGVLGSCHSHIAMARPLFLLSFKHKPCKSFLPQMAFGQASGHSDNKRVTMTWSLVNEPEQSSLLWIFREMGNLACVSLGGFLNKWL